MGLGNELRGPVYLYGFQTLKVTLEALLVHTSTVLMHAIKQLHVPCYTACICFRICCVIGSVAVMKSVSWQRYQSGRPRKRFMTRLKLTYGEN